MAWFSWQRLRVGQSTAGTARSRTVPQQRSLFEVPDDLSMMDSLPPAPTTLAPAETPQVNLRRIAATLDLLDIRYLSDGEESLLALWERHALLFAVEGPDDEILVIRARPHATVPPELADLAYRAVNEWNHTRRFAKAYVGDPTERGQLPIYAEWQVPLRSGVHDALLMELLDCAASVSTTFVDWMHSDGGLLL
ncbi:MULTISPECIES: YbjN domain-containing protein [Catellatospora]|nr:putative sensory transduction regulator [Catellatospora citrea]